jgi:methylglutaconyl-CoA hydratase
MSNTTVLWEMDRRGVATVTLNRPEVNNAYNGELIHGLLSAMDDLGARQELRVVVLRGNGKHFQAGADLRWLAAVAAQPQAENVRVSRATAEAVHRLNTLPVPTVALVHGGCFGGGTGIVAACDIVIAADDAVFSISETRWGLMAGIIIPQLNDAMGVRQVRRYALTGERFDAREARRIGMVHEVVPLAELESAGARILDQLLQNAPEANAQTKAVILESAWGTVPDQKFDRLVKQHAAKRLSREATEGLASFRERRPASWYPGRVPDNDSSQPAR